MSKDKPRRPTGRVSGDEIAVEAAWLYHNDGLTQGEIAQRLGVSRASVVNYLHRAREAGLVRVSLDPAAFLGHRLSRALGERFGLAAAYVVPSGGGSEEEALRRAARGTAAWLPSLLAAGDTLGVAWGRTVYEVAGAVEPTAIPDIRVVQLVGSMATPYGFTAETCSALLARRLGAACINLHAPAILTDAGLAARLRREPIIEAQLTALGTCNKALFAAGSCTPSSHIVLSGIATPADLDRYVEAGAAGVLCGRFVDAEGRSVRGGLDDRMMGVELDRLLGLEMGLLVSAGEEKAAAMRAVLAGGFATHLVTDAATAELLLAPP